MEIGVVKDKVEAAKLTQDLIASLERKSGMRVTLMGEVEVIPVSSHDGKEVALSKAKSKLESSAQFDVNAHGILVENQVVVATKTREEANGVLDSVKDLYAVEDSSRTIEEVSFAEKVEVREVTVSPSKVYDAEAALKIIATGTEEEKEYKVAKGESFWSISRSFNISESDLAKANPDVNPEKIKVDQVINLVVPKPYVTVMTKEKVTFDEPINYKVVNTYSSNMYKGETRVKVSGTKGIKEVTVYVYKVNGVEDKSKRETIGERVAKQPIDRVLVLGTKPVPTSVGSGTFRMPTVGILTSAFGEYRGGGNRHMGIDLANKIGTPIRASDGGSVIFSGWQGTYGYLIIIDHGGGFQTYYAHNSKLLVRVGQKVYQGQMIAEMGSSGKSTGSHLHFEIRKFGTPVNPYIYLD